MKHVIIFELSGKFAHFKFPFTSPNKLKKSFSIPPKTTILGLIGSMIGLNGFQQFERDLPEYYEKLNQIPISIGLSHIPLKKLIIYNSLNSFANNIRNNPTVNVREEILLNPKYEIGLLLDDSNSVEKKIIDIFSKEFISSKYHIYLGKNEFFANIINIRKFDENEFKIDFQDEVESLDSIIPLELLDDLSSSYRTLVRDSFSIDIDFSDKKLKTKLCEVGYFLGEEKRGISFLKKINLCKIDEKSYFFV